MTKNKKKGLVIGIVLAMLVLLGGLTGFFLYRAADPYDNQIVDNISIAGVDVGDDMIGENLADVVYIPPHPRTARRLP